MAKPSIPKGTRDFSPTEVAKRQYIIQIIKSNFEKFGFMPIETPSFENSETLMGKYGEEGDRLIFKILDSGDYISKPLKYIDLVLEIFKPSFFNKFINERKIKSCLKYCKSFSEEINNEDKNYIIVQLQDYFQTFIIQYKSKNEHVSNEYIAFLKLLFEKNIEEFVTCAIDIVLKNKFYKEQKQILLKSTVFSLQSKLILTFSTPKISEKALRYDLTVPFARYVVQHQNEIDFPFKRYQIQPVWRADRPQKGRFREFFQCDADVVGSKSLWQEVEFIQLYDAVFTALKLQGVTIKINNRKILSGIAEVIDAKDKLIDFTVALDKLDKIGEDGVKKEMLEKGISESAIQKVQPLFSLSGSFADKIKQLSNLLASSAEGMKGIQELTFICDTIQELGLQTAKLDLEVTLARGLNYYTGAIFEVSAPKEVSMGSIGGGGRYDDLTGIFGLKDMSGVGISFGLDRIGLVLEELDLFPKTVLETSKVLFVNYGNDEALYSMKALQELRADGIKAEMYPDDAKVGKQLTFADKRGIPFAVIAGTSEMQKGVYNLKDFTAGTQQELTLNELKKILK